MLVNDATIDRPIYQDIQRLTDAQLSTMCKNHGLTLGPINLQNRRMAERKLHIAMITVRAKYRAQQQFVLECNMKSSANSAQVPPPQNYYQPMPPQTYWPSPRTNLRSPPPPSWNIQTRRERTDPVLEPRQNVCWSQQNRMNNENTENSGNNFLGFKMPFSLGAARDIRSLITNSIKRFQGGETENAPVCFQDGPVFDGTNTHKFHPDEYEEDYQEYSDEDSAGNPSTSDREPDTLSGASEDEDQEVERKDLSHQDSYPYPFSFRELQRQINGAESQHELRDYKSFLSLSSVYHDWWWQWRAKAGDERIPEAERTTEQDLLQERELKTINYLSEAPSRADDGMLELMGRVELRDDSEEEVLEDAQIARGSRSWVGFCRHIFHLLCCDRQGKLDPEKLRCSFFCCCMAFGVYMGIKMMR
ncbi:GD23597 [Drosophila simulans]|uniref:GD23597 n=1 Tax=Drosophila simulans TaxID=7240 RepID=B4Q7R2_DROSI|nr:GD23597 [Drosophila simulans]